MQKLKSTSSDQIENHLVTPGRSLSHFQITDKIGEGGMGSVYKARDLRLGRTVAIKVLRADAVHNLDRQTRFLQEAKAASALNHRNIVTVYETDRVDDMTFIAMEYVHGRTLNHLVPRNGLLWTDALKYAVQIADALAAAHRNGIIHRDLKPANIMVTAQDTVKVLDFGLAKLIRPIASDLSGRSSAPTMTSGEVPSAEGMIVGTAEYMSPEQIRGAPIDPRSDIFSFGVVLYEMLTGTRPFRRKTRPSTIAAIITREPKRTYDMIAGLPRDLDRVVTRCLRKDPSRRFQNAADLHVALAELKEESDSGQFIAEPHNYNRSLKRERLWKYLVGVVATLFVILCALVIKRFTTAESIPNLTQITTFAGSALYPSFSPDGNHFAFSWDGDSGNNIDIYVSMLGEPHALRLTVDPAADRYPSWSPDGKRIAFERFAQDTSLGIYVTSPLGGGEKRLSSFPAKGPMSWSPDGNWLAISAKTSKERGVFLLSADTGELRQLTQPKAPAFDGSPTISPNGRAIAYAACTGVYNCDILVQALDTNYRPMGANHRITHSGITCDSGLAWSHDGVSLIFSASLTGRVYYLWRVEAGGQRLPQRIEIAGANAYSPSIAPNGKRLIFSRLLRHYDIWQYRVDGGLGPLIVSSSLDQNSPQFSPDGSRIAFESNRSGDAEEIWVAHADGSGAVQLTDRVGRHQGTPRWSPDGRWLAFDSQGRDGHWDIYVVEATGGRPGRITFDPTDENMPSWSRDGKWIYFASNRTGQTDIWRVPFPGGQPEQVTVNGGATAFESTDAKTLFYIKGDISPLFAKNLSTGAERQLPLEVRTRAFVPAADGVYFIGSTPDNIQFPLEFFNFETHTTKLLMTIVGKLGLGLTVSPDGKAILFTKRVSGGADLMMIDNFR